MIRIKGNLPLLLSGSQLLYVEIEQNSIIDAVFSNIEQYPDLFKVDGGRIRSKVFYADEDEEVKFDLVYVPHLIEEWSRDNVLEQVLGYNYPSLDMISVNLSNILNVTSTSYTKFFSKIFDANETEQISNGLLLYSYSLGEFLFCPLRANDIDTLTVEIRAFFGEIETLFEEIESSERNKTDFNNYALPVDYPSGYDRDWQEYNLDEDFDCIVKDIRDKISSLIKSGHERLLLRLVLEEISKVDSTSELQVAAKNVMYALDVFKSTEEQPDRAKCFRTHYLPQGELSPLIIDPDYRILLPEYNNLEIKLTPLQKAVYFLFLRHPRGIMFKQLQDYQVELQTIYSDISNREWIEGIEKSIEDICNPVENSINEKCSRIKEAFLMQFNNEIAQNYYITGVRGYPKLIALDRTLVTWKVRLSYDDRDYITIRDVQSLEDL